MDIFNVSKIRKFLYRRINDYQIKTLVKKRQKDDISTFKRYQDVIEQYQSAGGFKVNQIVKLLELKKILEQRKPTSIVELGTGMTSVVFYDYAKETNSYFTGVDENKYWLENSKKLCGYQEGVDRKIQFVHAERVIISEAPVGITAYNYKFTQKYDMVFIDGPSTQINDVLKKENYNSDIFEIVKNGYPETIVVDSRRSTVDQIAARLGNVYDVKRADHWERDSKIYNVQSYNHFTVFTKVGK